LDPSIKNIAKLHLSSFIICNNTHEQTKLSRSKQANLDHLCLFCHSVLVSWCVHTSSSNVSTVLFADDLETMMTTLQTALALLLILGSFFGLGFFEYPFGHSMPYLSCAYVLAIWGLLIYFVYYPTIFFELFENPNVI